MNAQIMPAPWHVGYMRLVPEHGGGNHLAVLAADTPTDGRIGHPVCVLSPLAEATPIDKANARLIASAPVMRDALWTLRADLGRMGANADTNHPMRGMWELANDALQAGEAP